MQKPLSAFVPQEERETVAQKAVNKREHFMVRWNLTKENLTDKRGNEITNAIVLKAMKFLENGCVKKITNQPKDGGAELWIVEPIEGYNVTTYTVWFKHDGDSLTGGCNCQYSTMKELTCSHLLAVLVLNELTGVPRMVVGGSRHLGKRIKKEPARRD